MAKKSNAMVYSFGKHSAVLKGQVENLSKSLVVPVILLDGQKRYYFKWVHFVDVNFAVAKISKNHGLLVDTSTVFCVKRSYKQLHVLDSNGLQLQVTSNIEFIEEYSVFLEFSGIFGRHVRVLHWCPINRVVKEVLNLERSDSGECVENILKSFL